MVPGGARMEGNGRIQRLARRGLAQYRSWSHGRGWALAVRSLEQRLGRRVSPSQRAACRAYASEVLGDARHTESLSMYCVITGEFRHGWIPWSYYTEVVTPKVNGRLRSVAKVKTLSRRLFRSEAFPDVAYVIDGAFFDVDYHPLSEAALRQRLAGEEAVVCKPDVSYAGRGVRVVPPSKLDLEAMAREMRNGVLQTRIVQHAFFDEFVPGGTSTLRIFTVADRRREVSVRAAHVKFHRTGERVVEVPTLVLCTVDPSTGVMSETGFTADWAKHDRHPDTGARFFATEVPGFRAAADLCVALHRSLPHVGVVGWDLIIDAQTVPRVLEWNGYSPSIRSPEILTGPCFQGLGWESLWREER